MINEERAQRALRAMAAYDSTEGRGVLDTEYITDLLTDLHHALDAAGSDDPMTDMDSMLWTAHEHFNEEKNHG